MKELIAGILLVYTGFFGESQNSLVKPIPEADFLPNKKVEVKQVKIDNREYVIKKFLSKYSSPLKDHSKDFIESADFYNLDYRLLPAISGVESTFGTAHLCGDFNVFGYGNPCWDFESFRESIWQVAKTLGKSNGYKQFQESSELGDFSRIYNPAGGEAYTHKIRYFISEAEGFAKLK